jgi:three-Cys-motif partner protein
MSTGEGSEKPPSEEELYVGREQSRVKHRILRSYLGALARIVGPSYPSVAYVDAFAGPWGSHASDLKDSSFSIALDELRSAKADVAKRGKRMAVRCYFVERDRKAYARLSQFAKDARDADGGETDIETENAAFEDAVPSIRKFVSADRSFPFIFIDPKGHSGFGLEEIRPLLQLNPGEVLINFMTRHNRRFVATKLEAHRKAFGKLFGSLKVREQVRGLTGDDRTDFLVRSYMQAVRRAGNFEHMCTAVVLNPLHEDAHFHLVYGTRSLKGVEVFKSAVARAMRDMEAARADAQQRRREQQSGQRELGLFTKDDSPESRYFATLRSRYLGKTKQSVLARLRRRRRFAYDDLWAYALSSPLTFTKDFNEWLSEWEMSGDLRISRTDGPRQGLKWGDGLRIEWVAPAA